MMGNIGRKHPFSHEKACLRANGTNKDSWLLLCMCMKFDHGDCCLQRKCLGHWMNRYCSNHKCKLTQSYQAAGLKRQDFLTTQLIPACTHTLKPDRQWIWRAPSLMAITILLKTDKLVWKSQADLNLHPSK